MKVELFSEVQNHIRHVTDLKHQLLSIAQDLNIEITSSIYDWSKEGPNARQKWFEAQINTLTKLIQEL